MKNKFIWSIVFIIIFSSCYQKAYLPASEDIGSGTFGSYVRIKTKKNNILVGELISVDSNQLIVLSEVSNKCRYVKLENIKRMRVQYARGKEYGPVIGALLATTVFHGWWVIITVPVNLIWTSLVAISSYNRYKVRSTLIRPEDLKYYARFPGGIPENIDLNTIH